MPTDLDYEKTHKTRAFFHERESIYGRSRISPGARIFSICKPILEQPRCTAQTREVPSPPLFKLPAA